jgi:hypothetical protein
MPEGMRLPIGIGIGVFAVVALFALLFGSTTSAMSFMLALVVDPELTELRYARATVAVIAVPTEVAVGIQVISSSSESFAPGVKARNVSVPTVPPPSLDPLPVVTRQDETFAAAVNCG